jgi:UrcA family protein
MSYAIRSSRPLRARPLLCGTSAALWLLLTAITRADTPTRPPAPETRSARVTLADLDLASAEGAHQARKRVTAAAQRLCRQLGDTTRATNRATVSACVRDTVSETMKSISSPEMMASNATPD